MQNSLTTNRTARRNKPCYYWRPKKQCPTKKEARKSSSLFFAIMVAIFIFFGFTLINSFLSVFDIKSISLSKEVPIDTEEIIKATGIELGSKLYKVDVASAEQRILTAFPAVRTAKVKRVMPDKIVISLEYDIPRYYICVTNEYFLLSADLRVLERHSSVKTCKELGLIFVELPKIKRAVVGESIVFFNPNDSIYVLEVLNNARDFLVQCELDRINLKNKFDIHATKRGYYQIDFGDYKNMQLKLKIINKVLDTNNYRNEQGLIFNISNVEEARIIVDKQNNIK